MDIISPHQVTSLCFEITRRGEMCIKKSAVLAKANSKIFLCADCPVSLSPKGAALSPKYCVRFFRISLRLVLQKPALSLNEIIASKIKIIYWCGNNCQILIQKHYFRV